MSNIKNYTSGSPASLSMMNIEKILIELGARNIAKEYDDHGKVKSIQFSIPHNGFAMPFKLPAKVEAIKKLFVKEYRRPTAKQIETAGEQAERTAWKNLLEWVQLQATMIKLEQVEFLEVFLPYAYSMSEGQTLFERMKGNNFKQLS